MDRPKPALAKQADTATRKGEATRQILLSSAIQLVATTGYAATTVQAVLEHAGVSRGTLLHHYPTRDHLMVATADEAMARMLAGIRDGLRRHADPLKGMADYPNILWRIQNDLPARAHTEIQLASRWDAGPGEGLRKIVADMNDLVISNVQELASQTGLKDVPGLIREIYILISATQGMAINRNLTRDRTQASAALALLRERFVGALRERMQLN